MKSFFVRWCIACVLFVALFPLSSAISLAQPEVGPPRQTLDKKQKRPRAPLPPGFIQVVGNGSVSVPPDMVRVELYMDTVGEEADQAIQENTQHVERVLTALKELGGIAEEDIQTAHFSITPQWSKSSDFSDRHAANKKETELPHIIGYRVSNGIEVSIRVLDQTGAILDRAIDAGINRIGAIEFMRSEKTAVLEQARKDALSDARRKAQLYAQEAGVNLRRIRSISDMAPQIFPPFLRYAEDAGGMSSHMLRSVPIRQGEMTFTSQIYVVWEIGAQDSPGGASIEKALERGEPLPSP